MGLTPAHGTVLAAGTAVTQVDMVLIDGPSLIDSREREL
jgi:hypothetical protein